MCSSFFTAEYLIGQFHSNRASIPKVKTGLDVTRPDMARLIRAVSICYWFSHPIILNLLLIRVRFFFHLITTTGVYIATILLHKPHHHSAIYIQQNRRTAILVWSWQIFQNNIVDHKHTYHTHTHTDENPHSCPGSVLNLKVYSLPIEHIFFCSNFIHQLGQKCF